MNINDIAKEKKNRKIIISAAVASVFLLVLFSVVLNFTFSIKTPNKFYEVTLSNTDVGNITISDIDIKEENGITKYEATIKANKDTNINYIKIIFKDENNNELVSLIGYVGSSLSTNEEKVIEASTDADLSKVKNIEYQIL